MPDDKKYADALYVTEDTPILGTDTTWTGKIPHFGSVPNFGEKVPDITVPTVKGNMFDFATKSSFSLHVAQQHPECRICKRMIDQIEMLQQKGSKAELEAVGNKLHQHIYDVHRGI